MLSKWSTVFIFIVLSFPQSSRLITVPLTQRWRWRQLTLLPKERSQDPRRPTATRVQVTAAIPRQTFPSLLPILAHTPNFSFTKYQRLQMAKPKQCCNNTWGVKFTPEVSGWNNTLTDSNTDWARTSNAIVLLKNGCWVMSYILALKPSLSEKEKYRRGHFRHRSDLLLCLSYSSVFIFKPITAFPSRLSIVSALEEWLALDIKTTAHSNIHIGRRNASFNFCRLNSFPSYF